MPYQLFIFAIPALIFFIRFLMQYTKCDYYNPLCRFVATVTSPFLRLTSGLKLPHASSNIHLGALIYTFILGQIGFFLFFMLQNGFILPGLEEFFFIAIHSLLFTIWAIINLFFILLIICGILSWIPSLTVWNMLFRQLTSPLIAPLDRVIPPIGVISISYMVGFFIVYAINYMAFPFLIGKISHFLFTVL